MSTRPLNELLLRVIAENGEAGQFDLVVVVLHDARDNVMRLAAIEPAGVVVIPFSEAPVGYGPSGDVWRTQEPRSFSMDDPSPQPFLVELGRTAGLRRAVFLPLTTPRQRLGAIIFASREARQQPAGDLDLLNRLAAQIAFVVESTTDLRKLPRPFEAEERDRAELLLNITNAISSELDLHTLLPRISALLIETIAHHFVSLTLWDEAIGKLRRHAMVFEDSRGVLKDGAIVGDGSPAVIAFERGATVVLRAADIERLDEAARDIMHQEGLRTVCCTPLITPRAKLGTLNIGRSDDYLFPPQELLLLERLAQQLAIAIENAQHMQRAEAYRRDATRQRDRLRLLLDINNALITEHESRSLPISVLEAVRHLLPHDYASLTVLDQDSHELRVETMTFYDSRGLLRPQTGVPLGRTPAGITFLNQTARIFHADELRRFDAEGMAPLFDAGITSILCVPLTTRHGVIGTLNLGRRDEPFTDMDLALLSDVGRQVAIAVENTIAFQQISQLRDRLAEEKLYLEGEITANFMGIVGHSQAMASVIQQVRTVAPTDATVLLLGETGTGKELLARAIHENSRRRDRTFVKLNGAALPATLVESELFGYEKGAFTGAVGSKAGRLELAHRGTLFIDEVGDIGLDVQPKLLRAIQEQEFERLGSTRTHTVDVRMIAATNRDLDEMVQQGLFRSDLYYRLNVFPIRVPPLRDRPEDISPLTRHFVQKHAREMGRNITTIPAAAMEALERWQWPGNIRELENVIERAVILSPGDVLQVPLAAIQVGTPPPAAPPARGAAHNFQDRERDAILSALRESRGVIGGSDGAAARLGLKRTTLHSKMRKLGINRPSY